MKQIKATYRIASIFIALLLVFPIVFISMHMLLHHHDEKSHSHENITFCDKELELCKYDNYTFTHFTPSLFTHQYWGLKVITFTKKYSITKIYFRGLVSIKRGRAPPTYSFLRK